MQGIGKLNSSSSTANMERQELKKGTSVYRQTSFSLMGRDLWKRDIGTLKEILHV